MLARLEVYSREQNPVSSLHFALFSSHGSLYKRALLFVLENYEPLTVIFCKFFWLALLLIAASEGIHYIFLPEFWRSHENYGIVFYSAAPVGQCEAHSAVVQF